MKEFVKWLAGCVSAWATFFGLTYLLVSVDVPHFAATAFVLPFYLFALGVTILNPAKRAIRLYIPDGKIKRLLLFRIS